MGLKLAADACRISLVFVCVGRLFILWVRATQPFTDQDNQVARYIQVVMPAQRIERTGDDPVYELVGIASPRLTK